MLKTSLVNRMPLVEFTRLVKAAIAAGIKTPRQFGEYATRVSTVQPLRGEDCDIPTFWTNKFANVEKTADTTVKMGVEKWIQKNVKADDSTAIREAKTEARRAEVVACNDLLNTLRAVGFGSTVKLSKEEKQLARLQKKTDNFNQTSDLLSSVQLPQ